MIFIYILHCKPDHYYIGKSTDPLNRFMQHINGNGGAWTRLHEPMRILRQVPMSSDLHEDQLTEEWMMSKGIDKVRGGMYCQIVLPPHIIDMLRTKLRHAQDACLNCGALDHYVGQCNSYEDGCNASAVTKTNRAPRANTFVHYECEYSCGFESADYHVVVRHEHTCYKKRRRNACGRCGRGGHHATNCYARTTPEGDVLSSDDECSSEEGGFQ
jgi:predicted GIY-YIG superfamily endonuclease